MKAQRTHKKDKGHRFQKNERTNPEMSNRLRLNLIKGSIVFGVILFLIGKTEFENVSLYRQGETTKALVYRRTSKGRRGVSLYEFNVSGIRYTSHDHDSKVGDTIDVVYLPKNPKINRNAEVLDQDCVIWLYRKIVE